MSDVKWFGRDPAVLTAQVVSLVIAVVMLLPLTPGVAAAIIAVATAAGALVVAFSVAKDGQMAALTGFARAGIALAVVLGVHWPETYQGLLLVAVEQVFAFLIYDRVTAAIDENGRQVPARVISSRAA